MRHVRHQVDFCVVGGGISGLCAAVAAARRGASVALLHDRPVLGGNTSSEVRMWICGARGPNNRETGIIEELHLDNMRTNPHRSWSMWDCALFRLAKAEPNLKLFLNCSVVDASLDNGRLRLVRGWQGTAETWHEVEAEVFADCSGDSILIPLTGAAHRIGREASSEFSEDIQPDIADKKTMGMSILMQARETDSPQLFEAPSWANTYPTDESLPYREHCVKTSNWWWIELGGDQDSIHDTEELRDELLKAAFGVWDHVKNRGDHGAENWVLDWVGFLPGKRESRRYEGDYIMTQGDVRSGGRFNDTVAYGGWTMDDHHPAGLQYLGKPTIFHQAPSPFGIPYRSLYSRNIENLFCAGRNISVSHAALSATRVMATCATIGQAVGTAAALAVSYRLTPREVYREKLPDLQQSLMDDDCYLPGLVRNIPAVCTHAQLTASEGDPKPLLSGVDRPVGDCDNCWEGPIGSEIRYTFAETEKLREACLVFDSDLNRQEHNMPCNSLYRPMHLPVPSSLVRSFRIECLIDSRDEGTDNPWRLLASCADNHHRFVRLRLDASVCAIRFIPESTWGCNVCRIFRWDVV